MKGLFKCFGLLLVCSIIFGLFLNDSSDVSAVNYNNMITFSGQQNVTNFKGYWRRSDSQTLTESTGTLTMPSFSIAAEDNYDRYVDYFVSDSTINVKKDHAYEIKMWVRIPEGTSYPLTVVNNLANSSVDGITWTLLDVTMNVSTDETMSGGSWYQPSGSNASMYRPLELYPRQIALYSFLLKPSADADNVHIQLNRSGNHLFYFPKAPTGADLSQYSYKLPAIQINVSTLVNEFLLTDPSAEMNEKDEQDRDNLESQSSQTDSDAADSASDAESQGTTLLGAFSAFVTALTSASPSNCVIDMDLGNLDMGNVDFCTLSPPQPIPTIASIFLILFCVPLSIATAKKVINLFRSFQ